MAFNRTIFTYRDPWGSEHELALVRTIYQMTGNLAVEALVADRGDEEYGQTWCNVTVNLGRHGGHETKVGADSAWAPGLSH